MTLGDKLLKELLEGATGKKIRIDVDDDTAQDPLPDILIVEWGDRTAQYLRADYAKRAARTALGYAEAILDDRHN